MPRKKRAVRLTSGLRRVQTQARSLLARLRKEIRSREAQLKRLRQQGAGLGRFAGRVSLRRRAVGRRGARRRGRRINWGSVLARLPKEFSASHVRSVPGIKSKRPSEIFAAITRWIDSGSVKRKARGAYEKA